MPDMMSGARSGGPAGSVGVMPAELMGRLEGQKRGSQGAVLKPRSPGVEQFHTLEPMRKGKSEEDLVRTSTMSGSDTGSASPAKSRFRRRASGKRNVEISTPVTGTFRKVAGVREDKPDGGTSGFERSRTVEIDLGEGEGRKEIGFEFELRRWTTLDVHEAIVTHITPGSLVDQQHLLEIGDILLKVNNVSIAKINNKDELQFLMTSGSTLVLSLCTGDSRRQSVSSSTLGRPATADGFFTTPEPPGNSRRNGGSQVTGNPLTKVDTIAKFVPGEIDPEDMECAYDTIELYPEKKDPKKDQQHLAIRQKSATGEDEDWHYRSNRESVGLLECMEGVVDLMLSKDLTGEERRQRLAKHLGMDVNLPSLQEESETTAAEKAEPTVRTRIEAPATNGNMTNGGERESRNSATSDDRDCITPTPMQSVDDATDDSYAGPSDSAPEDGDDPAGTNDESGDIDDTADDMASPTLSASSRTRIDRLHSLSGVLHITVADGAGFLAPSSLRCVISMDDQLKQETCKAGVDAEGHVSWDECFAMDVDDSRSLVISCFASTGSSRDSLSGRATVQLEALFRVAGTRRLQLTLAPRGSVQLDLSFTERIRLLKRFPSDDQYFGVFGIDLSELVAREHRTVPFLVAKCVQEVEARGLETPGIYRVSGSFKMKGALRDSFEADSSIVELGEDEIPDVTIIAALLLDYLQELPEPLLTNVFCADLVRAARRTVPDDARRERLFDVLQDLPPANLDLARLLFRHFHLVLYQSSANKHTERSIAVTLGPALLCPAPHARGTAKECVDFDGMATVVEAMLTFGWPDTACTNEETTF